MLPTPTRQARVTSIACVGMPPTIPPEASGETYRFEMSHTMRKKQSFETSAARRVRQEVLADAPGVKAEL